VGYGVITHLSTAISNYRYRSFINKIINAKLVVMVLAMMMGQATNKMP
jgi:hypothetical protein